MAVLGSESNVYDITRNNLASASTTNKQIGDIIDDTVPGMIEENNNSIIGDSKNEIYYNHTNLNQFTITRRK